MRHAVILGLLFSLSLPAADPQPDRGPNSPAFKPITDDPKLPRVLLIGDSISIDYTLGVRALLRSKANVYRVPENGGPTLNGVAKIDAWLSKEKWDVIHFNWGLHDLKLMQNGNHQVPLENYVKNLRELVKKMKATGAVLIWASTTPVPEGKMSPPRNAADVPLFNAAAKLVMDDEKVVMNDLFAYAHARLGELQISKNVHFKDNGSAALAGRVAAAIETVLKK